LLIDGEWCAGASGKTIDVVNPATGGVIGTVAHAGMTDLERAVAAARRGWEANRLPYGLAGCAFARSFSNVHLLSHSLEVGMLWINQPATPSADMPFGGVKDSGYGSEGGPEALEPYLVSKAVTVMSV
jgi:succinate-semialdehyde dehydrogenase / glutarate-semialdehyde dehydrogenase